MTIAVPGSQRLSYQQCEINSVFFWFYKCIFLIIPIRFPAVEMRKSLLRSVENSQVKIISFQMYALVYIVNRALPYFHEMSLKIMLIVPLRKKFKVSILKGVRYDEEKVTLSLN